MLQQIKITTYIIVILTKNDHDTLNIYALIYRAIYSFKITFLICGNTGILNIAKDDQIFKEYLQNKLSDLIKLERFKVYYAKSLEDGKVIF